MYYEYIFIKEVINMPRFDQTGPMGQGPMTGRGMGPCGRGRGMGRGMGFRFGRGYGRGLGRYFGWNEPQTKEEKTDDLKEYLNALKEEIEEAEKEIKDLQSQS